VDVNDTLRQTIGFLENEAVYRNIHIRTDLQPDLPRVSSDTSQLQQVFLNILDNGLDAVEKNGTIDVRTRHLPGVGKPGEIEVAITDSGKGIPKDKLARIFDPFFTTKKPGEGTGLGLSISYSIIDKLGGRLAAASEEGHGATFTIHLPVR
jgi:two-component system NtrC family sensor kinase